MDNKENITTEGKFIDKSSSVDDLPTVEYIPGTRLLVDAGLQAHEAHDGDKDIILIPQPSSDPDDPLNWSTLRKYTALGIVCFYTFFLGGATISPGVTYGGLIVGLGASVNYLNTGAALMILFLGLGNLILTPLAIKFGRRPVYLFSAILACVSQIVAASAKNKETAVGARILLGFAASPFEQLPAVSINDQFFVHHRGFGLQFYVLGLNFGSTLGPVAAGYVLQSMGWRWVYWFYAIFLGALSLIIFLFLEETAFPRDRVTDSANETKEPKALISRLRLTPVVPPTETSFLTLLFNPIRLLLSPIVVWGGFNYGFAVSWLSIMSVTAFTVFQSPVYGYDFTFGDTGLTNLSVMIGALLALYVGGAGTDQIMVYLARRNKGIMEAETRVYSTFFAAPIMMGGLILYGVGAAKGLSWIGPVFGMGMIGAGIGISGEVSLGYASESFAGMGPKASTGTGMVAEAVTALVVVRNIIGCAMTFAIAPWIEHSGLKNAFITIGMLAFVILMSGFICIIWGKAWRRTASGMYRVEIKTSSSA